MDPHQQCEFHEDRMKTAICIVTSYTYIYHYSQWQTRHVLGNINGKRHYTPHQDSFFVFRCFTGSTETFINVISNTTASAIPLITVFANSLRQAYPFRNQKPATNARYYDNIVRRNNTLSP